MGFYVKGHSNNMTDLIPEHLEARKNIVIGEYILKSWRFESNIEIESGEKRLKVTMVLTRKFFGIFMVTYLPTILMNVINQASNYISSDSRNIKTQIHITGCPSHSELRKTSIKS